MDGHGAKIEEKFRSRAIKLIFYGPPETEDGNPIALTNKSLMKNDFYSYKDLDKILLEGSIKANNIADKKVTELKKIIGLK